MKRDPSAALAITEAWWGPIVARLVYLVAFVGPLSSVPQIVEIWIVDKSAAGVSFLTWSMFLLASVVWFLYGLSRRDRPLMISNGLWILGEAIIVVGAVHFDGDLL